MKAENTVRLLDVWVGVRDPRQAKKVEHRLVKLLGVAVCAVLSGADTFVAVEVWRKEKLDWLRKFLPMTRCALAPIMPLRISPSCASSS